MNRVLCCVLAASAATLPLAVGCEKPMVAQADHIHPASVDKIDGSAVSRVTLSDDAMKRLDIHIDTVGEKPSPRTKAMQLAVPYSALIYDALGNSWVYTNPQSRVFVRAPIEVDYIQDGLVFLKEGPKAGTPLATVGVAELYGTEFTVGH